jgi:tripeptide aminopeptidase
MVNAAYLATEFAQSIPKNEIPAKTEGREGFYHLIEMSGDVAHSTLVYIIRDHDADTFESRKKHMLELRQRLADKYPKANITCQITDSYENMISVMNNHKDVIKLAEDAIRAQGLTPISRPIRGGTDGARLSFMGLPCPNLGTGGYGFHGPFEHVTLEGMETVVNELIYIAKNPLD